MKKNLDELNAKIEACRQLLTEYGANAPLDCIDDGDKLNRANNLLRAITKAQSQFISNIDTRTLFAELLDTLLPLTMSEYGFIGEVFYDPDGTPYLKEHAITNIAWDDATRALLEEHKKTGLEFRKLNSLYGAVIRTGKPVIANDPANDPRRYGLPHGHPAMHAFMGIPFFSDNNGAITGMVGLANRPGGYDESLIEYLKPFLSTCANILKAHSIDRARKIAETELLRNEISLEYAQHIAKLGHWELDLASNKLSWSRGIYEIFEIDPNEFKASYEGFLDAIHPEDRELVNKAYSDSVRDKQPYEVTHRLLMKNGSIKYVIERGRTDYAADGTPLRSIGTIQDITERKKIDDSLAKIDKLDSLGVLAGGIAHDFNNLLTAIIGNIYFARQTDDAEKRRDVLATAEKATLHAKELTNQLLTFAKGGAPVRRLSDIGELVRTSGEFIIRGSNARCEFHIANDLKPALVDPGQISQVVNNIVINAVQAMPEGGLININLENTVLPAESGLPLPAGRYILLTIADSGPGIPPNELPKIFDPYYTTKVNGNGLGLPSVFSIVKKHSGFVDVISKIGEGTSFRIFLPASDMNIERAVNKKEDSAITRGSGRVLVMDDEELIRDVSTDILTAAGYEVLAVPDGKIAVDEYVKAMRESKPFDAIILDITVPGGMGGKEAIEKLLAIDPQVKAIVSSGYSQDAVMSEYERYGFKKVVLKPYTVAEFSRAIHEVLSNNPS